MCSAPEIMEEHHSGPIMAGHFSGVKALLWHWRWPGMYTDIVKHCSSCPQCAIVNGSGRINRPPLHPIPVQRPFQITGRDIIDLPITTSGNHHVVVFQDFLTKWPLAFAVPDQKNYQTSSLNKLYHGLGYQKHYSWTGVPTYFHIWC